MDNRWDLDLLLKRISQIFFNEKKISWITLATNKWNLSMQIMTKPKYFCIHDIETSLMAKKDVEGWPCSTLKVIEQLMILYLHVYLYTRNLELNTVYPINIICKSSYDFALL